MKGEIQADSSRLVVNLSKISGLLIKTKYEDTAEIEVFFDIHNNTISPSPQIDAMYLYTGSGWSFKQDGKSCAQTRENFQGYRLKHFIDAPVARLPKGGWAQVRITGEKVLASAWRGEERRDEYKLSGTALMRIMTSSATFDSTINLSVDVDEIPF